MILCVGLGNTHTIFAYGQKDSYKHFSIRTSELDENFHINENITGGIISSVVPEKTQIIKKIIPAIRQVDISKSDIDFTKYKSKIGEDRAVCCIAALAKYKPPFVVIDFGTAITVNVIDKNNCFIGGAILAGVQTGIIALNQYTAQLPFVSCDLDVNVICDNTLSSILSGAVMGNVFAVEGYIRYIESMLKEKPNIIVTGGDAEIIVSHCNFEFTYEPLLLIEGLFELYSM